MTQLPKVGDVDCLIIGGGPAGLTAAIYLARFLAKVRVVDAGKGRAAMIPAPAITPLTRRGIPGAELLARMREQALEFGARIDHGTVATSAPGEDFVAVTGAGAIAARAILRHRRHQSTPRHDQGPPRRRRPLRTPALLPGLRRLRGHGPKGGRHRNGARGVKEAVFLRSYTADLTLIAPGRAHELDAGEGSSRRSGRRSHRRPRAPLRPEPDGMSLLCADSRMTFALDLSRHGLAGAHRIGGVWASLTEDGCVIVDSHQRTSVPGLSAAGDVVMGLDQISHAMGEAGVAATTIRNDLAKRFDWRRPRERATV